MLRIALHSYEPQSYPLQCEHFYLGTIGKLCRITRDSFANALPNRTKTCTLTSSVISSSVVGVTQMDRTETTATSLVHLTTTTSFTVDPRAKRSASVSANPIPTYASACSGEVRYSSACSCLGATAAITVTALAPTTWVTSSVSVTYTTKITTSIIDTTVLTSTGTVTVSTTDATSTVAVTPIPTFVLQVYNGASLTDASKYLVSYVDPSGKHRYKLTSDLAAAQTFQKASAGRIQEIGTGLYLSGTNSALDYLYATDLTASGTYSPLSCTFSGTAMSCTSAGGSSQFGEISGQLVWANSASTLSFYGGSYLLFRLSYV